MGEDTAEYDPDVLCSNFMRMAETSGMSGVVEQKEAPQRQHVAVASMRSISEFDEVCGDGDEVGGKGAMAEEMSKYVVNVKRLIQSQEMREAHNEGNGDVGEGKREWLLSVENIKILLQTRERMQQAQRKELAEQPKIWRQPTWMRKKK